MISKSLPPGPKGHFLFGSIPEFVRDPLGFVTDCAQTYGDCVYGRFGHRHVLLVNHPELIEETLVRNDQHFVKNFALRRARHTLGNGLFLSSGEVWQRNRKLVQPAFQRDRVASFAGPIVESTLRTLDDWEHGQTIDLQDCFSQMTGEIIARLLFDVDVSEETTTVANEIRTLQKCFLVQATRLLTVPAFVPTPLNRRLHRATRRLERIIYRILDQRQRRSDGPDDLLARLLNARDDETGQSLSRREIRDEVMTLFLAGHETTAISLVWTFVLLAQNPEIERTLHQEVDTLLGRRSATIDDVPRLKFAQMVVDEAMRLYPPVWMMGREAVTPCTIGDVPVSPGMNVYFSQWVVQRDSRFFPDPLEFRPSRWEDGLAAKLPRFAYFPFGGGPHVCLGAGLARIEVVLMLATILQRFHFDLLEQTPLPLLPSITLRPDGPVRVRISNR